MRYEGEYAPEPLLCWSEYEVDENPEGFEEACSECREKRKSEFSVIKLVMVHVRQDTLVDFLVPKPMVLQGVLIDSQSDAPLSER